LIVDNVDDLGLAKEFIPVTDQGRVLLTTRAQATRELAPPLPVEKLDTEFGGLFLLRLLVSSNFAAKRAGFHSWRAIA
jgi:hypothetical protein